MALELTENAERALEKTSVQPQLVLEIEGVSTIFGAVPIQKYVQIGDPGLEIGDDWVIGGLNEVDDQEDILSLDGTGTRISQQLMPDKGAVSSASSIAIQLIDSDETVTQLISPGVVVTDLLFRRASLWMGFQGTAWPDDYVKIFSGFIDEIDSGPGNVKLNLVHPDIKKKQDIFQNVKTNLDGAIDSSQTTITLDSASNILEPELGPDGVTYDPAIKFYVRIDDEIIRYTAISGLTLTGCTRAQLGTLAAAHSDGAEVSTFYVLEDDVVNLALKVMLSGKNGAFVSGVEVENFEQISPSQTVQNAIFFDGIDISDRYGVVAGDYITTTGASNGSNNVSAKTIASITTTDDGSYIVVNGVTFVVEVDSAATISFRSQYDTLGEGLQMTPQDVDVEEHLRWRELMLGSFEMRFYLKDTVNGKDFIEREVLMPPGGYSLPRKGKVSMGYHIGPVPTVDIAMADRTTVKNPSRIRLKRSTSRHFYNTIVYSFEEDSLEDKFLAGNISIDQDSKNRIQFGTAAFKIVSKGMRVDLLGQQIATQSAQRRLGRYRFGAEYFEGVQVLFKSGFNVEPGDLVLFDFDQLKISNTSEGNRKKNPKFYEVMNKTLDLKTGQVEFVLLDTNFDSTERYGLISPSSVLGSGSTTSVLVITDSFGALFPGDEKRKWEDYIGLPIQIHDADYASVQTATLLGFDPNDPYRMQISTIGSPPPAGYIVDIADYSTSTDPAVNALYKQIHAHWSPIVSVVTGISGTSFTVGAGDVGKFFVGAPVVVHNADFSDYSPEVSVASIVGVTITVDGDLGFTPTSSHFVQFIGFADEGFPYRFV